MRVGGDWTGVHRKTHRDAEPSPLNLNVLMEHEETVETQLCCLMGKRTKLSIKDGLEQCTQDLMGCTHQTLEKLSKYFSFLSNLGS